MLEKDLTIRSEQTCFEVTIFLDAILEDEETFQVILNSTDSGINVSVSCAEITILDITGELYAVL